MRYLFPWKLQMTILQLEGYNVGRFLSWVLSNFLSRALPARSTLVYTNKAKGVLVLAILSSMGLGVVAYFISSSWVVSAIVLVFVFTQPYIGLVLASLLVKPYMWYGRYITISATLRRVRELGVPVVAVTGSYGKTSVKNILAHIMRSHFDVLMTPASYNTIYGIAKVVELELDSNYDFFLCEIGAFKKGDIWEMCEMVEPQYGIAIGINEQHLERFGSLENTISAKLETAKYLKEHGGWCLVNGEDRVMADQVSNTSVYDAIVWKSSMEDFSCTFLGFDNDSLRSKVRFVSQGKEHILTVALLGEGHIQNIGMASYMAWKLGVPVDKIVASIESLPQVAHRLEIKRMSDGYTLVDNAYSSNTTSFRNSLTVMRGLSFNKKILVTPGVVELGEDSERVHMEIAKDIDQSADVVILVGESARVKTLQHAIALAEVIRIETIFEMWDTVRKLGFVPEETLVLIENDVPDNY